MTPPNHFILARPFIESAVARCADHTAYSNADLHHACGRLVLFVGTEQNVELTDAIVFAAPTIEKYIATLTDMTPASRGNLRSMLYRMAEVLLGTTGKGDMSYALSASSPSEPYSAAEVSAIKGWAGKQSDAREVNVAALIGLGFGAGLSASEIAGVRVSDVERDSDGSVHVSVTSGRYRRVQVDEQWRSEVDFALEYGSADDLFFCPKRKGTGKNLISNFIARGSDVGLRPNTQRMRATYLVKHIEAGDSVKELMRIAGVQSLDALARYVRFVSGATE
jgi:integrase